MRAIHELKKDTTYGNFYYNTSSISAQIYVPRSRLIFSSIIPKFVLQ